ncbi:acyltransferase family protein [Erwinia sorbitola]|uniref:acyltransferase family protein n=1 Tax=Erwinia sorbitola TaxID=2681984 RepID=UPI0018AAEE6E|nr:acyltransferase [Erwinia sorbitola]
MKNNILSITYLRAIACMLVVVCHAESFSAKLTPAYFTGLFGYGGAVGKLGVYLFFMISGYLMACVHWEDFGQGKMGLFVKKRLVRILPMYYLFTLITIMAWVVNPGWFPSTILTPIDDILSLLFIPSVYIKELDTLTPVLSVGWTLCYEMLFYLVFAVGMLFSRRSGMQFIFITIVALVVCGALANPRQPWSQFYTNEIMLYFLSGISCFMLQKRLSQRYAHSALSLTVIVVLLAISTLWLQGFPQLLLLSLCFFMLTGLEFSSGRQTRLTRIATGIGLASYSIYLCHRLFMGALEKVLHVLIPTPGTVTLYLAMVILSVASAVVGYLIYWLIEKRTTMAFRFKAG